MENESDKWFENGEKAYEKGLYGRALKWFSKAAEQGDDRALKRLGDMYFYGYGVEEHYGKAMDYYHAAKLKGNSHAGYLYNQVLHVINLSI